MPAADVARAALRGAPQGAAAAVGAGRRRPGHGSALHATAAEAPPAAEMLDPSALLLSVGREGEERERREREARAAEREAERRREEERARERYDRGLDWMLDGASAGDGGDEGAVGPTGGAAWRQQQQGDDNEGAADRQQQVKDETQQQQQQQQQPKHDSASASERQALAALETWTEGERTREEVRRREHADRAERERLEVERSRRMAAARSQRSRSAGVKTAASDLLIALERKLFPPRPKESATRGADSTRAEMGVLKDDGPGPSSSVPSSSSPTVPHGLQSITDIDVKAVHPLSPAGLLHAAQRCKGTAGRWIAYRAAVLVAGVLLVALYLLVWVGEEEIAPADRVSDKTIGHTRLARKLAKVG